MIKKRNKRSVKASINTNTCTIYTSNNIDNIVTGFYFATESLIILHTILHRNNNLSEK